jgi:hypothetical protein
LLGAVGEDVGRDVHRGAASVCDGKDGGRVGEGADRLSSESIRV